MSNLICHLCGQQHTSAGCPTRYAQIATHDSDRAIEALEQKLAICKEALEFYASALDLNDKLSPFGEPNQETGHMPARLGTRARDALKRLEEP